MSDEYKSRKNIRLRDYDYSQAGYYYVTICVKGMRNILCTINVGTNCVRPLLSKYGIIVENEILQLSSIYDDVGVVKHIVMPNHIHMIVAIENDGGRTQFVPTISRIVKQFKGSITKKLVEAIWQPRFYDRVIRDEAEFQNVWRYIDENPLKWVDDEYYRT